MLDKTAPQNPFTEPQVYTSTSLLYNKTVFQGGAV